MTDETTSEQLAEIEGQAESTPATGYTPPEGWRVLAVGEVLQAGDMWVWPTDDQLRQTVHVGAVVGANQRYIRRIESQPEPQPVQVREGRWRTRGGDIRNVTPTLAHDSRAKRWPWRDVACDQTWTPNGQNQFNCEESPSDLVEYLGPIEPEPEPQPESDTELQAQVAFLKGREVTLGTRLQQEREVTTRLRGELAAQAETIRQLQIELDAALQVPADSPELRQLRADLEQMTLGRDTYRDGYDRVLSDLRTIRETAKAEAIEAIVEWLVPIRTCGSEALATAVISNLPHIMRSLTGLDSND